MEHIAIDARRPEVPETGVERHRLSEFLGTTGVAINRYRIAPGEAFPAGLHAHADQEEVFVVLEGEATFGVLALEPHGGPGRAARSSSRRARPSGSHPGSSSRVATTPGSNS